MKFDGSSAPEPLDYDFTSWGVDAKGTVPEPTDLVLANFLKFWEDLHGGDQQERFQDEANRITAAQEAAASKVIVDGDLTIPGAPEPAAMPAPVLPAKRTWSEILLGDPEKNRRMADEIGCLCQLNPDGEQIAALPRRVRDRFITVVISMHVMGDETGGLPVSGTSGSPAAGPDAASTT